MRLWLALLALVPACGFQAGGAPSDGGDGGSGSEGSNTPDALSCYGSIVRVCLFAPPTAPVALTDNTDIDTGTTTPSPLCDQHNDKANDYCVVAGTSFSLAVTKVVTAHGSRPLVILASGTADISGTIDVSSHHTGPAPLMGAGAAAATSCPGTTVATGTAGGFGGSLGGKGADGVDGNPDDGSKGLAAPAVSFQALRGGCPGGDAATGAKGGNGGGAVAVIAAQIQLNGGLNASGAAGMAGGAVAKSGGGGGGAGGMIILDSPSLMLGAKPTVFANGGGGGQGGALAEPGLDGAESTLPDVKGSGGRSGTLGGNGGDGPIGSTLDAPKNTSNAGNGGGGGGGGGGAGIIHAPGLTGDAAISPPSTNP